MKGDMQILTWEYCQNQQMARFAMNSLQEYQCLVLETLEKKQSLFVWRADVIGVECAEDSQRYRTRPNLKPSLHPRLARNIQRLPIERVLLRFQIVPNQRQLLADGAHRDLVRQEQEKWRARAPMSSGLERTDA